MNFQVAILSRSGQDLVSDWFRFETLFQSYQLHSLHKLAQPRAMGNSARKLEVFSEVVRYSVEGLGFRNSGLGFRGIVWVHQDGKETVSEKIPPFNLLHGSGPLILKP